MFWDKIADFYDIFADRINRKTDHTLCQLIGSVITSKDWVLECACGTGLLSGAIAKKCQYLVATDYSVNMLRRAKKKYRSFNNIEWKRENILHITYLDESFDKVVAANVIHLLDDPVQALRELDRVCKKGGMIVIPTYMNRNQKGNVKGLIRILEKIGVDFKQKFTLETYKKFFRDAGYKQVTYDWIEGVIPCAVAIIRKEK